MASLPLYFRGHQNSARAVVVYNVTHMLALLHLVMYIKEETVGSIPRFCFVSGGLCVCRLARARQGESAGWDRIIQELCVVGIRHAS